MDGQDHDRGAGAGILARATGSDQVLLRTARTRRLRVIRSVLTVLLVLAAVILLSAFNRNRTAMESCRERMDFACREFQQRFDAGERSPAEFPLPADGGKLSRLREHVYYNWLYTESAQAHVGVCCCRGPHTDFFKAGRYVLLFDVAARKYEVRWMDEAEFAERAEDLGLRVRLQH